MQAGKVISCEFDTVVYEKAKERLEASPLRQWMELRNESSLEMQVEGTIDLLFSDSDVQIREAEVKRFLPQMTGNGVILMHDASSHMQVVRAAALKMEDGGIDFGGAAADAAGVGGGAAKGGKKLIDQAGKERPQVLRLRC
jgi:predicted O-methyltransferase YrrM